MTGTDDFEVARRLANEIAATFAAPKFNSELRREREISWNMLHSHPLLKKSRVIVEARDEHFGHGFSHLEKVATDAGGIVQAESARMGISQKQTQRIVFLVLLASLLHDIMRRVPNHAQRSAKEASEIILNFPLEEDERDWIVCSIRNHEAFTEPVRLDSAEGQLLSDALYDADKFRWGPDNFTDTIWDMISPQKLPIQVLLAHFQKGMEGVKRVASTFRSDTGKKYGPEFIDIGIAIGNRLHQELMRLFPTDNN